jgi:hypothetical protein
VDSRCTPERRERPHLLEDASETHADRRHETDMGVSASDARSRPMIRSMRARFRAVNSYDRLE